jgi:hypothetical protein
MQEAPAPISVLATLAERRAEFVLTAHLLEKLTPILRQVVPALLRPAE